MLITLEKVEKYYFSFVKLQLNQPLMCLDRVRTLAVYRGSESSQNILICVQNMNEGITVWNDMRGSN